MKDIVNIWDVKGFQKDTVEIDRHTPMFLEAANNLGDYLKTLPLSNVQHNKLTDLLVAQVNAAEHGAYLQGVSLGVAIEKSKREDEA